MDRINKERNSFLYRYNFLVLSKKRPIASIFRVVARSFGKPADSGGVAVSGENNLSTAKSKNDFLAKLASYPGITTIVGQNPELVNGEIRSLQFLYLKHKLIVPTS